MSDGKKLSTEPYKGVRDFYPEDQFIQNYLFDTMCKVAESFGYVEYNASPLEPSELYKSKTSEEIVNEQTYTFTDRGDREVTLRPEMTPTVARMLAARRREIASPARWYSIPNVFRYERPQRGRLREHYQLNCDIFGVSGVEADTEIIALAHEILRAFGAKDSDFEIRVNSRVALQNLFASLKLTDEQSKDMLALIDRKDKINDFETQAENIAGKQFHLEDARDSNLDSVVSSLKERGMTNVVVDTSIARGFLYYTGIVFEVFDTSPENNRSLFGGGRYDNLLDLFGVDPLPAVGFGMGDVTLRDFLETHNLLPKYESTTHLYVGTLPDADHSFVHELAKKLRNKGINVALDFSEKKAGDKIKTAVKQAIPYLLLIGKEEQTTNTFRVKDLRTEVEGKVSADDIPGLIRRGVR